MDADNRVVLNCGGIRHEVYKVSSLSPILLPLYIHNPAQENNKITSSLTPGYLKKDPCYPAVQTDGGPRQL